MGPQNRRRQWPFSKTSCSCPILIQPSIYEASTSLKREKESELMMKFRRFGRRSFNSKLGDGSGSLGVGGGGIIEWEVRPGGMLVQMRGGGSDGGLIKVGVSMGSHWHNISIGTTSTFGELKMLLLLVIGLEPSEQRLLYKGKEREDSDHLHIAGVQDSDKLLLLEDPASRDRKLNHAAVKGNQIGRRTIIV